MQAVGRRDSSIRIKAEGAGGGGALASLAQSLDFYREVPSFEMQLDEFEDYALGRLKILRKIETMKSQNTFGDKNGAELDAFIKTNSPETLLDRKRDLASHFILRAAYCSTGEQRRWFLTQECALFRHRLEALMKIPAAFKRFLENVGITFERIDDAEKERLTAKLLSCPLGDSSSSHASLADFSKTMFYKIPFIQALDLVRSRLVYVEGGYVYVPTLRLDSIVTSIFRDHLYESLIHASKAFSAVVADDIRIGPMLKNMSQLYTGRDYSSNADADGTVTSQNIDDLAKQSMPLCMRQLHDGLKIDHKLKHWGRLQYGLFLKGAGMTMEESLIFFQNEFGKIMSSEQFQKNYSYNIRHMYGKEGKRASYTPYNCQKIILGHQPQTGDHHGCPFKNYGVDNLSSLLSSKMVISAKDKEEILELKRGNKFQIACQKHFLAVHPGAATMPHVPIGSVGNHPNDWFHASCAYHSNHSKTTTEAEIKEENRVVSVTPLKTN